MARIVCLGMLLLAPSLLAEERVRRPRAVLVADAPLTPGPAVISDLQQKLSAGYSLLGDGGAQFGRLERPISPETIVQEALREALARMRRLALDEVQRTLEEAEPYLQQLPPSPSGRELFAALALRRAHILSMLQNEAGAIAALQRGLSAAPDFTVDQALEPPDLVALFNRVRAGLKGIARSRLRVSTSPPGATLVMGGTPLGTSSAPLTIQVPAGAAVVVWAVRDGYQPRNLTVQAPPVNAQPVSVEISLEATPLTEQARPLLSALRHAEPLARPHVAEALCKLLRVDAVALARLGPYGRPQLHVYGPAPRMPQESLSFDMTVEPLGGRKGLHLPPWLWGVAGVVLGGGIATGIALGVR